MVDLYKITPLAVSSDLNQDGLFIPFDDGIELMQFTGLKDRNGREIYEGDILVTWNDSPEFDSWDKDMYGPTSVFWSELEDQWDGTHWRWQKDTESVFGIQFLEVIGNIYENPGLLKD